MQTAAYERSLKLVREALTLKPNHVGFLSVLAGVHFRWGKFREAAAAYNDVLRVDPGSVEATVDLADCYAKLEDDALAVQQYRKAVESNSPQLMLVARKSLAEQHFKNGRFLDAVTELRTILSLQSSNPEAHFLLGRALSSQAGLLHADPAKKAEAEKWDVEAALELERAVQLEPATPQAYYILSNIHRRQGQAELAKRDLEKFKIWRTRSPVLDPALAEKSDQHFEARTAIQVAKVFLGDGDFQRAEHLAQLALNLDSGFNEAVAYKAWVCYRMERLDEAAGLYESLLSREPQHAEALWNLGNIRVTQGQLNLGVELILRAAQSKRMFPEAWESLARLSMEKGVHPEKSEEYARMALKQRPSRDNYLTLAALLHSHGQPKECKAVVEEALRRFPQDPELLQALENIAGDH